MEADYRGHIIVTSASGMVGGPWLASYSVWKPTVEGDYNAVSHGFIPGRQFEAIEEAYAAARLQAQAKIDEILAVE